MSSSSLSPQHGQRKIEKLLIEPAREKRIPEAYANRFRQDCNPSSGHGVPNGVYST